MLFSVKGRDVEKVDAPDIVYLSSFDEFLEEWQEALKYQTVEDIC